MSDKYRPVRDIQPAPSRVKDLSQIGHPMLKSALAALAVLILAVTGMGYYSVGTLGSNLANSDLNLGGTDKDDLKGADGAVDILLVGSDSRTDAQGNPLSQAELARLNAGEADGELNTDTIIVVRVPNDGSRATAVSIPRDTYVRDSRFGNTKINGVYGEYATQKREQLVSEGIEGRELEEKVAQAGQQGLIDAVADLTGVQVDHYAEVGLLGFVLLTDAVGGVEVCLNNAVNEPLSGANFPAGNSTLDGAQALAFVRQRHDLPRGDLDRIVRQQVFMASLVNEIISAGTLSNPNKLRELSVAVERSLTVDKGWNIMSMATQMSDLAAGNVTFQTIPVTSINGVGDYGESIVTVDVPQVHAFMDNLAREQEQSDQDGKDGEDAQPAETPAELDGTTIDVLNAGGTAGLAAGVAAHLKEQGATVDNVSNAVAGVYYESQIVAARADDPAAIALANMLGGLPITVNESLDSNSLIVVTADDYAGPSSDVAELPEPSSSSNTVGTPGEDFGSPQVGPEFNAGGSGPRCVN
ncbi:LCP family protein [Corynebacterium meitnerae]|uniref:LCP family protein n=1 Tax=Corynebacterium meitnerae TaxID=2913498 RepID=A0A9X3LSQ9_9CORY|nr:LCP family protein [Corynebacterium meitnerae]